MRNAVSLPPPRALVSALLFMGVIVVMVMVVVMFMLLLFRFRARMRADVWSNEFIQEILFRRLGDESYPNFLHAPYFDAHSFSYEVLDPSGLLDCPCSGHPKLYIHQEVLPGFNALH